MTEIATEIITYENEDASVQNRKSSASYDSPPNVNGDHEKSRNEDRYGRYEVLSAAECEAQLAAEAKQRLAAIEEAVSELDAAEVGRHSPERGYVLKCFSLEQANAVLTRFAAKTGIQFTLLGKYGEVGHRSEPQVRAELDANAKRLHFKSARVDYDGCAHALLAEEYFVCRCGVAERSWSYMHAPEADLVRRFQHRKTCLKQRLKRQLGIVVNRATRIPPEKRRELERRLENEWQMRLETYRQTGEVTEEEYATLTAANSSMRRAGRKRTRRSALKIKSECLDDDSSNAEANTSVKVERDQLACNERNVFIYITQIFRFPQYRLLQDTPNARSRLFAALRNDWLMPSVNVIGECIYIVRVPPLTNHRHALTERQLRAHLSTRTDVEVGLTDRSRVVRPVDKRGIPRWVGERVYFTVSEDVIQFIRRLLLEEHMHDDYAIQQRIKQRFVSRHGYAPSHGDYFNYPTRPLIRHYMRKFAPSLFADENETAVATTTSARRLANADQRSVELYGKKKRQREYAVDDSSIVIDDSFVPTTKLEPAVRSPNINMLRVGRRDLPAASSRTSTPSQVQARHFRGVGDSLAKKRPISGTISVIQHGTTAKSYSVSESIGNVDVYSYPEEPDESDVRVEAGDADGDGEVVSYAYVPSTAYDYADADAEAEVQEAGEHSHEDPHAAAAIEYSNALEIGD